jgi:hypothetical protein
MNDVDVLSEMTGVREYGEGYPVELVRNQATNRLVLRAWNECHNNKIEIDLYDLLDWLQKGPKELRTAEGFEIWTQSYGTSAKR